jgi:probable phosphoglycerate mutase
VIAARLGAVVEEDVRLREQHLGGLEGLPYEESWAAAEAHDWSDPGLPVAGGESPAEVWERMVAALEEALAVAGTGRPTVLVTHGDALRTALAWAAGESVAEASWVEVPNGAVFVVRPAPGRSPRLRVCGLR